MHKEGPLIGTTSPEHKPRQSMLLSSSRLREETSRSNGYAELMKTIKKAESANEVADRVEQLENFAISSSASSLWSFTGFPARAQITLFNLLGRKPQNQTASRWCPLSECHHFTPESDEVGEDCSRWRAKARMTALKVIKANLSESLQ